MQRGLDGRDLQLSAVREERLESALQVLFHDKTRTHVQLDLQKESFSSPNVMKIKNCVCVCVNASVILESIQHKCQCQHVHPFNFKSGVET